MTPHGALEHVCATTGETAVRAEALSGGLLNHVFRVWLDDGRTVIVKHAPPHVASAPHIPLDAGRSAVEAAALRFMDGQRTPRLLGAHGSTIIIEDIGDQVDLAQFLADGGHPRLLDHLARWLRRLHDGPRPRIHNLSVQRTRLEVQYAPAADWLAARGVPDAASLGARLARLGTRFLGPGPVFIMGDLWPASVRARSATDFVVIDWELSTCGFRAQDLGHLTAHLHLEAAAGRLPHHLSARFLDAYGTLSADCARDTALHRAAELLARTVGAFPRADLTPGQVDPIVHHAIHLLRTTPGS